MRYIGLVDLEIAHISGGYRWRHGKMLQGRRLRRADCPEKNKVGSGELGLIGSYNVSRLVVYELYLHIW